MHETIKILLQINMVSEPAGFEVYPDFTDSPIYSFIRGEFGNKFSQLVIDKPVRRLIFNGPLLHFTFYSEG